MTAISRHKDSSYHFQGSKSNIKSSLKEGSSDVKQNVKNCPLFTTVYHLVFVDANSQLRRLEVIGLNFVNINMGQGVFHRNVLLFIVICNLDLNDERRGKEISTHLLMVISILLAIAGDYKVVVKTFFVNIKVYEIFTLEDFSIFINVIVSVSFLRIFVKKHFKKLIVDDDFGTFVLLNFNPSNIAFYGIYVFF